MSLKLTRKKLWLTVVVANIQHSGNGAKFRSPASLWSVRESDSIGADVAKANQEYDAGQLSYMCPTIDRLPKLLATLS